MYDIHVNYILLFFILQLNFIHFNLHVPLRKRSNNRETQITIFLTVLPRIFILSILRDGITLPVKLMSSYTHWMPYTAAPRLQFQHAENTNQSNNRIHRMWNIRIEEVTNANEKLLQFPISKRDKRRKLLRSYYYKEIST